jgi:cytidine deaminase
MAEGNHSDQQSERLPSLIFGIVAPAYINTREAAETLKNVISDLGLGYAEENIHTIYITKEILCRSRVLAGRAVYLRDNPQAGSEITDDGAEDYLRNNFKGWYQKFERIENEMTMGNKGEPARIRKAQEMGDALRSFFAQEIYPTKTSNRGADPDAIIGVLAAERIRWHFLESSQNESGWMKESNIVILHRLILKNEVEALRKLFGERFYVLGIYSAPEKAKVRVGQWRADDIRNCLAQADYLIDGKQRKTIRDGMKRFVRLLFSDWTIGPTWEEYGMFMAWAASLRSSDISRQVGAAILDEHHSLLAIGTNEVPRPGGGLYWEDPEWDHRDVKESLDSSPYLKAQAAAGVLFRLLEELKSRERKNDRQRLLKVLRKLGVSVKMLSSLLKGDREARKIAPQGREFFYRLVKDTRLKSVLDFGRSVHAEMAAITDAALRGIPLRGCRVFVTTFPCHNCARHIIASGAQDVYYIEPYPKSLVSELHDTEICLWDEDEKCRDNDHRRVKLRAFFGVAPRFYPTAFGFIPAEDKIEHIWEVKQWNPRTAFFRKTLVPFYLGRKSRMV